MFVNRYKIVYYFRKLSTTRSDFYVLLRYIQTINKFVFEA